MPVYQKNKKDFSVYHWDTFDNETLFLKDFDTLEEAQAYVKQTYGDRIRGSGADQVDIVDKNGNIVTKYKVG